jgi:hypothetical protein
MNYLGRGTFECVITKFLRLNRFSVHTAFVSVLQASEIY